METPPIDNPTPWEQTEAAAWISSFEAAPAPSRTTLGLSCEQRGAMAIFRARSLPAWFFNRVTGVGLDAPADRAELDQIIDDFVAAGTECGVCVTDAAQPQDIPTWLEERGFRHTTTLARLIRSTSALPSPSAPVQIRAVGRQESGLFGHTARRGFDMPAVLEGMFSAIPGRAGWRTYVAFIKGEPAATGALFVSGKIGWLGFGSTLPEYRGRGIHGAMLARRMADATDLGCRWLQTETNLAVGDEPTPSLDNIREAGFQIAYQRKNYVLSRKP